MKGKRMTYKVTREAMRIVERDDKGRVKYRRRLKKGDSLTEKDIEVLGEARLDSLLESNGGLVDTEAEPETAEDDEDGEDGGSSPADPDNGPVQAPEDLTPSTEGPVTGTNDPAITPGDGASDASKAGDGSAAPAVPNDVNPYEDKDKYSYAELQALAKDRTGDGSGGRETLEKRLFSFDQIQQNPS